MLAIDTNIVVRYLTGDDLEQSPVARALIDENAVSVCDTVLLECAWVLQSVYNLGSSEVARVLRSFLGLPNVHVDDTPGLVLALDRAEAGMDFADALHLSRSDGCTAFITFDAKFVKAAAQAPAGHGLLPGLSSEAILSFKRPAALRPGIARPACTFSDALPAA